MDSAQIDSLWDWGNPAASEQMFRKVGTPEAMTQVARALGLQGKIGEAHKILDGIEMSDQLLAARATLERGRLYNDAGEGEDALSAFREALAKAQAIGAEYYAVDAMHMIAICQANEGSHRAAIKMAEEAIDERAKSWDASLLNNLGWTLFEQGKNEDALQCFQDALQKRESRDEGARTHVAKWCVARVLRELKRNDEALDILYPLLDVSNSDGYVYDEIGENLLAKGNLEAARPYFDNAVRLLPDEGAPTQRRAELGRAGSFAEVSANSIIISRAFRLESDFIWLYAVSRNHLPRWLGTVVPTSGKVPNHEALTHGMIFDLHIDNDADDVVHCEVIECIHPRKLTLKWNVSTLTMTVVESTLTLTHEGIDDPATYGAAWHSAIDLLSHVMAGGSRETFNENFEALLPEYRRLTARTLNLGTR